MCAHCEIQCAEVQGIDIWPQAGPDLAGKILWRCPACSARVGSHPDGRPLGTAASPELRNARILLHGRFDPLWKVAHAHEAYADSTKDRKGLAIISKTARRRCYRFLAERLGLAFEDMHIALLDIEECRRAWVALRGVTYDQVRVWAKNHPEAQPPGKRPPHRSRASGRG
jgi:hypothetical protein